MLLAPSRAWHRNACLSTRCGQSATVRRHASLQRSDMAGRFEGKVVFVTGAGRGQGRAHAVRFAEEGADVIGLDICADIPGTGYSLSTPADLDDTVALVGKLDRRMI